MQWVDTPTGHHCNRHNADFLRGEVCHRCIADPGDEPTAFDEGDDDEDLRARIHEARSNSRYLIRKGKEWIDDGTAQERGVGLKAFDCAAKWERIGNELQEIIEGREHDRRLIQHERQMSGLRSSH